MKVQSTQKKLSYESYCRLRLGGEPVSEVYQAWRECQLKQQAVDTSSPSLALCSLLPLAVAIMLVVNMFYNLNAVRTHKIWITSPSGNTTRQLPLYQALRVIKRKRWHFTQVAPVKAESAISRKNALRILLFGNNKHNSKQSGDK